MTGTNKNPNLLEDALRNAVRREDAPEGFVLKVLARAEQQNSAANDAQRTSWLSIFSQPVLRWSAVAAVTIAMAIGTIYYRNLQRQRAEGEAAKQQLMLALRIAGMNPAVRRHAMDMRDRLFQHARSPHFARASRRKDSVARRVAFNADAV